MSYAPDKRQYPRRAACIIAEYTVLEGKFQDAIKNIGSGGLFIKTSRNIVVGQPIKVKFPMVDVGQSVESTGRVVRRDSDGFAVTFYESIEGLVWKEGKYPEIIQE